MKFWKLLLLVLWMFGMVFLLIFYIIPQEEALNNDTIKKLEIAKQKLEFKNVTLDLEISKLKKQADSLSGKIYLSNKTIHKLQNARDEKIDSIARMSTMDLYSYFARFKADSTRHK